MPPTRRTRCCGGRPPRSCRSRHPAGRLRPPVARWRPGPAPPTRCGAFSSSAPRSRSSTPSPPGGRARRGSAGAEEGEVQRLSAHAEEGRRRSCRRSAPPQIAPVVSLRAGHLARPHNDDRGADQGCLEKSHRGSRYGRAARAHRVGRMTRRVPSRGHGWRPSRAADRAPPPPRPERERPSRASLVRPPPRGFWLLRARR